MTSPLRPILRRRVASRRPSGVSQTPPLPSNAFEYWHGELGATAANAVGQKAGIVCAGQNTPTVAVDTGFFNERPVYQATATGNRCWYRDNATGTIIASGTRPYLYIIARWRSVPAAVQDLGGPGQHLTALRLQVHSTAAAVRRAEFGRTGLGSVAQVNGNVDTLVHRFEAWMDGTDRNFRVDGVNAATADSDTIGLINSVGLGCNGSFPTNTADASIAFLLICTAKPTDPEIAALNAWAQAYWGAP